MNKPLWTLIEAHQRAAELLEQFARCPDVLSPDEQALAMEVQRCVGENQILSAAVEGAIRRAERAEAHLQKG